MDWEWFRPAQTNPNERDWFVIRLRRAIKHGEHVGFSLTMVDRPHGKPETEDKTIFRKLDDVWDITRPLFPELRAEGWEMLPIK